MAIGILIVEKSGSLKQLNVKDFVESDLYKKCGFKKSDGFNIQTEWIVKLNGQKFVIVLYAKKEGRAGFENKYDFPPPVDNILFFGSCILVCYLSNELNNRSLFSLSIQLWENIYEKLFAGFEDLTVMNLDNDEQDELENIPKSLKTKIGGYLKDGFVVDDSDNNTYDGSDSDNESDIINEDDKEHCSELSEESYDYSEDEK
jgi:hypothetical protein